MHRIGLISDTHNLLRPEAKEFLQGCDHILHAGDICGRFILDELAELAPVTAVMGNNDRGGWADALAETEMFHVEDVSIYMLHDLHALKLDPVKAGFQVIVSGHSHRPVQEMRNGVLYINPGSAGPRRFHLPISVGELLVDGATVTARLVTLAIDEPVRSHGAGHSRRTI